MDKRHIIVAVSHPRLLPNGWDLIALPLVLGTLLLVGRGAHEMAAPLEVTRNAAISLDPGALPGYALRTTLRMFAALLASLLFTFTYATLAAKSRRAELLLIPALDVLQSVPVLGFLSFTIVAFLTAFPGSTLGPECAAIFAIFTSQAWNMAFSFYQSLRTVPADLAEVSRGYRLSAWQRFWRLEVPFAMPGLVWNTMMSMSGGWFFVVASEAITVGDRTIALPGIGSYVAAAIAAKDYGAIGWAVLTMLLVIAAYDQLMFRPLVAWADKFRMDQTAGATGSASWVLRLIQRTRTMRGMLGLLIAPLRLTLRLTFRWPKSPVPVRVLPLPSVPAWLLDAAWLGLGGLAAAYGVKLIVDFVTPTLGLPDFIETFRLGLITLARVLSLIALATLVWVPVGVWIGLRPRLASAVQPAAQFLAAFPANLLFPVAVVLIVRYGLDPDIWLSPLMVLGTQWYILFNVIAGASAFPNDLREAAAMFRVRGWNWWRKAILPGLFPYYVTGAITASGGSWNASIVAEVVSWGDTRLEADGLGAYIARATTDGDYPRIVLGIAAMSVFVILTNRVLWRPLYRYAERRLRVG